MEEVRYGASVNPKTLFLPISVYPCIQRYFFTKYSPRRTLDLFTFTNKNRTRDARFEFVGSLWRYPLESSFPCARP